MCVCVFFPGNFVKGKCYLHYGGESKTSCIFEWLIAVDKALPGWSVLQKQHEIRSSMFIQLFCNLKTCSSSRNCHPSGGIFVYSALDMVMFTLSLRTLSVSFLSSKLFRFWKLPNHKVLEIDIITINCLLINKFLALKEFSFNELSFPFPIYKKLILQNYNVALNSPLTEDRAHLCHITKRFCPLIRNWLIYHWQLFLDLLRKYLPNLARK